jgi:L-serine dehydratase
MPVSIFNDVIGPVMRGPSSSHCAAALRIGRLARELMQGDPEQVVVSYDLRGALATTHETQGSHMGLCGGLMGWDTVDDRLPESARLIEDTGIHVTVQIGNFGHAHPNTYHLELSRAGTKHTLVAVSLGGGMIEVIAIDDVLLSIGGDYWETLIWIGGGAAAVPQIAEADHVLVHEAGDGHLVEIKAQRFVSDDVIARLFGSCTVHAVARLAPVLPVLSRREIQVPFSTCAAMLGGSGQPEVRLWELAVQYESRRADVTAKEVIGRMLEIVRVLRSSVKQGIRGTAYADRILGPQAGLFKQRLAVGDLLDAGLMNLMVLYVTALMEVKSAMGVIVAAPTAGSCAALPGASLAAADALKLTDEDAAKAMLAGGLIGVFIATASTFAAEVAGCQAECGAASGMTAAALATLAGGSTAQAVAAASLALQNSLGMICDPVANRVEVPCLGKNVMAATNALACANMALAGYDPVIPLDEVIETMDRVGRSLPRELRCTALGGLSVTETSRRIEDRLRRGRDAADDTGARS